MNYPGIESDINNKKLDHYAELVFEANKNFNLTGYKPLEEIKSNLIYESLAPFSAMDVPRGTSIADIGSGAGIPGIPISIRYFNSQITMIDSTLKKIEFIKTVINKLGIQNAGAINGRIEDIGRNPLYREKYDWVISRAMADIYTAMELGSVLVKTGGHLYLYVNERQRNINKASEKHISDLGMSQLSEEDKYHLLNKKCEGMLLQKTMPCNDKYPRRIKAIKNDARNFE